MKDFIGRQIIFFIFNKSRKIKSNAMLQCKVIRIGINILQKNGDFIERSNLGIWCN